MAQRTFGPTPDPDTGARYSRDPNTGAGPTSQAGTEMPNANSAADGFAGQRFGWLDNSAAAVTDARGTPYSTIGKGSAPWASRRDGKVYTLGSQRGGPRKKR
jgi:hypothetical protein